MAAYTEIRHVSGITIHKANILINELIAEGWQPASRFTVSESMRFSVLMAKGVQSDITEIKIVNGLTIPALAEKVTAGMLEGYKIGDEIYGVTSQSFAVLYKGTRSSEGGGGAQGPAGPQGPRGEAGPEGVQGPKGDAGAAGAEGQRGAIGPEGPQGIQGVAGPQGLQGPAGIKGEKGDRGDRGVQGQEGPQGPQGEKGDMGAAGPVGLTFKGAWAPAIAYSANDAVAYNGSTWFAVTGNTDETPGTGTAWQVIASQGAKGDDGDQGPRGLTGPEGPKGDTGPAGATGLTGPQGIRGEAGPQGEIGPRGLQGLSGAAGAQGIQGEAGPQGEVGPRGLQGATGPAGPQGIQGLTGSQGPQGATGPQGLTGATGAVGATGPTGPQGTSLNSIAYYRYSNVSTGLATMSVPLISGLQFRVRLVSGTTNIEFSVGNTGASRTIDYEVVTSNLGANPVAWTRTAGEHTVASGAGQIVGSTSYQGRNLRRFDISLGVDGDSGKSCAITVIAKGRASGSTYPMDIKIETFALS